MDLNKEITFVRCVMEYVYDIFDEMPDSLNELVRPCCIAESYLHPDVKLAISTIFKYELNDWEVLDKKAREKEYIKKLRDPDEAKKHERYFLEFLCLGTRSSIDESYEEMNTKEEIFTTKCYQFCSIISDLKLEGIQRRMKRIVSAAQAIVDSGYLKYLEEYRRVSNDEFSLNSIEISSFTGDISSNGRKKTVAEDLSESFHQSKFGQDEKPEAVSDNASLFEDLKARLVVGDLSSDPRLELVLDQQFQDGERVLQLVIDTYYVSSNLVETALISKVAARDLSLENKCLEGFVVTLKKIKNELRKLTNFPVYDEDNCDYPKPLREVYVEEGDTGEELLHEVKDYDITPEGDCVKHSRREFNPNKLIDMANETEGNAGETLNIVCLESKIAELNLRIHQETVLDKKDADTVKKSSIFGTEVPEIKPTCAAEAKCSPEKVENFESEPVPQSAEKTVLENGADLVKCDSFKDGVESNQGFKSAFKDLGNNVEDKPFHQETTKAKARKDQNREVIEPSPEFLAMAKAAGLEIHSDTDDTDVSDESENKCEV